MKISKMLKVTTAMALMFSATASFAHTYAAPDLVSEGNRWLITAYNDASPVHQQWATQGICFRPDGAVGTQLRYVWWSDTFPNWNGKATQEGDQVVMHGDYADEVGHDGMVWNLVTMSPRDMGTGQWVEWREDQGFGRTIAFANAKLERAGKCELTPYDGLQLPYPRYPDGREMEMPMGIEQEIIQQAD